MQTKSHVPEQNAYTHMFDRRRFFVKLRWSVQINRVSYCADRWQLYPTTRCRIWNRPALDNPLTTTKTRRLWVIARRNLTVTILKAFDCLLQRRQNVIIYDSTEYIETAFIDAGWRLNSVTVNQRSLADHACIKQPATQFGIITIKRWMLR